MTRELLELIVKAFERGQVYEAKRSELTQWDVREVLRFGIEIGEARGRSLRVERYATKKGRRS